MSDKHYNLILKLKRKAVLDLLLLVLFAGFIIISDLLLKDNLSVIIITILLTVIYILQYQHYKNDYIHSLQALVSTKINESEITSEKIIGLSKKQKEITTDYTSAADNVSQTIIRLKNTSTMAQDHAQKVALKAQESLNFSHKESESVKANISIMLALKQKIQIIAKLILELSDYIQQIGNTVGIVEDIAEQTNMLALNAAVEAARAGEHGKGFAVVAGEIRKLADESKQATTKISSLINDIEQATNSTVMATEEGTKEIESGVSMAHNIDTNIDNLISIINELNTGIEVVLSATIDQNALSNDAIDIIGNLNKGLNHSIENLNENIENIKNLAQLSASFKDNFIS